MATVSIKFINSNDVPINLQVDPWAGIYTLTKGKEIEIEAHSETNSPGFHIDEYGSSRILTILHSSDYYVIRNGKRFHWTKYYNDGDGSFVEQQDVAGTNGT